MLHWLILIKLANLAFVTVYSIFFIFILTSMGLSSPFMYDVTALLFSMGNDGCGMDECGKGGGEGVGENW